MQREEQRVEERAYGYIVCYTTILKLLSQLARSKGDQSHYAQRNDVRLSTADVKTFIHL